MIKKLLLGSLVVVGVIYGAGHDFSSLKRQINSASNENARHITVRDHKGWGDQSGY
ncbi:hypothetical protein K3148_07010 [Qipengyuania aurantiaca]|uniref:Uncharacterized protein n=1 Tax=Qipengyuania aurantiaca TaxID=2867233 RepID=A0ABX8ZM58_9SPHN|nr:hypothetical protein [Qipengyuania aurantiaca]QZD88627.1 hypothetical protein K3148_07010 [Qipengyuania aurantiaca]